ncbi:helix-turn-helix domain-containing protein [Congregibacter brevis]|uniref:Helix-turn-helix domain-containing protein n=1 Tax=Congregibacter brevis TaxID=3081201 RepID=A0ABZ0I8B8_9GAMM|nr:helix-turn-helix domain-containing protein [Congregibacter sp. IMCC45268]
MQIISNTEPQFAERHDVVVLPRLLNQQQLAKYLGKSKAWCERARWQGSGPRFIKLGRHVRYRVVDVEEWIVEQSRASTAG